ncbi:MAG: TonB-dependent receptor [Sphingomicrobium sp.]
MSTARFHRLALLAGIAWLMPLPAVAQTAPAAARAPKAATAARKIFTPADFARFSPTTAFDMLANVPGFTIQSADQERGLGQASENVLINGQRVANKSGGAIDQLRKVAAANVERIEIADAAGLGIAGLSGEVANVIVQAGAKGSGQFEWRPQFRIHYAHPNWFKGSASYSDKVGPVDYTIGIDNGSNRGAFGGPVSIFDPLGTRFEVRNQISTSDFDQPKMTARFKLDAPGSSVANLTLGYGPYWYSGNTLERRVRTDGDDRTRLTRQIQNGYMVDFNGDYEFALGPGRLKLIGLRHFEHEPTVTTQTTTFDSGADAQGIRFTRDARIGETIGRAEYGFRSGKNDWQLTLERADNKLAQRGRLFALSPSGTFNEMPFPEGSGTVAETRYEATGTLSRALSSKLDLQLVVGAEVSKLDRVDGDLPPRKFFRPKGSLTLGWRPAKGWDASFKLRRRVGQISFYDFLAQPNLQQDRENSGNPDLVPPQSWEAELEAGRDLGAWGKTRLKVYGHRIDDIIDIIPIGDDGEAVGNLPRATRFGLVSTSTIQFDPIGWRGAKLDLTVEALQTSVRDPLTGRKRSISDTQDRSVQLSLRDDIPHSKIAWGAEVNYSHNGKSYFLSEIGRGWEGPVFANLYVEHKDVFGFDVTLIAANLLNARHHFNRTVYDGRRERDPVRFRQTSDGLIGPIFAVKVKGSF